MNFSIPNLLQILFIYLDSKYIMIFTKNILLIMAFKSIKIKKALLRAALARNLIE